MAMNVIQPDYHCITSLPQEGKGGVALLYHPKLTLIDWSTMNYGCVAWAQLKLDSLTIFVAAIYAPRNSPQARANLLHQLKKNFPPANGYCKETLIWQNPPLIPLAPLHSSKDAN